MKLNVDRAKLERSLLRFSKDFGDTSAQAISRWGVQICRDSANDTLPWKKGGGSPRAKQKIAIERDLGRVVFVLDKSSSKRTGNSRMLRTAQDCIRWMDENRTSNNRTRRLSPERRKLCSQATFNKAVREMMSRAGIAKGGFVGAGKSIARAQRGADRITVGKNVAGYAHKFSNFGTATTPLPGFRPSSILTNRADHTALNYVIRESTLKRNVDFALKKTITWYRSAMRKQNKKQKP